MTGLSWCEADAGPQAAAATARRPNPSIVSDEVGRRDMGWTVPGRYPRSMPTPLEPAVGRGVLHLFCKVGPLAEAEAVAAAVKAAEADEVQVVPAAMLGHKCDLAFMALGTDLWRLRQLQTELAAAGPRGGRQLRVAHRALRVQPGPARGAEGGPPPPEPAARRASRRSASTRCPSAGATCSNWFTLPYDERKELMYEHGTSGRKFAGRVLQVITGSTGIDDFEWGVTLFAVHPDDLKEVVYTMRFDEASALTPSSAPSTRAWSPRSARSSPPSGSTPSPRHALAPPISSACGRG